jgi:regulation of enolase protein 1 (concanavalin A-like superfamily)
MFHQSSKPILLGTFVALLFMTMPVYAVKTFKTSNYGNAHQIWFEAEDYDERNPDTNQFYPVVDSAGASGKAITRAGGAGGMMRWTFDISAAGGKGGTWYFWARLINPANASDYMLVKGDPGDPTIPTGPPFPGGSGSAQFVDTDDRVFEIDVGPSWGWAQGWDIEGHTKELQNGQNTMYIFHRQGNDTVFWDVFLWTDSDTYVPTDADFQKATAVLPDRALNPSPANEATDVLRDVPLSWTPAPGGGKQDVYFGTSFDVVNQATTVADPGGVYRGRIDPNTYAVGLLTLGQTYYWRVDKVNAPPDSKIIKGSVWSFTVEPLAYRMTNITATASSSDAGAGPQNTINNSGMTNELHSTADAAMWLSSRTGPQPAWIQYEFDSVYKLREMRVWNYNVIFEPVLGFGFKDVTVEYSTDGTAWTVLKETQFARATGVGNYASGTTVDFGGLPVKFVRLTAKSNWGGFVLQFGLSEVRFYYTPVSPKQPSPASAATGVNMDAMLSWRAGREAASHKVYFGADRQAVADGTAPVKTVTGPSFDPGPLEFGKTYFWKVAEVNDAATPKVWDGDVWSFSTLEFSIVDDFESYTDDLNAKTTIFDTWVDGFADGFKSSGSTVGNDPAPFAERTIIHGGKQSMPLDYNNTKTPFYSEAERTWDKPQDWTANGADTLTIWFRGNPVKFVDKGNGAFRVSGSGHDIWDNADDFRFVFKRLSGNGSVMVKVDSIVNTNVWAKAGVMIRDSLDAGSQMAYMIQSAASGVSFGWRQTLAATCGSATQAGIVAPQWVKLTRTGNAFTAQYSADGKTWTDIKDATTGAVVSTTINMGANIYIGLCVTSHTVTATTTAEFSGTATTGGVTGQWEVAEIGDDPEPANSPAPLYVAVQDSAGKVKVISHPDPAATTLATWQQWRIPLSELSAGGVKITSVKKMVIGVGDRSNPKQDGAGKVYIDDIGVGHPAQ